MLELASRTPVLRKRLRRLLGEDGRRNAAEISTVILPQLQKFGHLALIGGAVRDVARLGVSRFRSDLDFVLYDGNLSGFRNLMQDLSARQNRFGGFSIRYARWRVDIWALEDTWAHTAGLRQVSHIQDLVNCTFFDWDAILFDLQTRAIITKPGYFDSVQAYVLDVNLEENPNPTGSLVRALRRGALWKVRFGAKLTSFVRDQLRKEAWESLVALDASAFAVPVLRHCDPICLRTRLEQEINCGQTIVTEPFGPPPNQLRLSLQDYCDNTPAAPSPDCGAKAHLGLCAQ